MAYGKIKADALIYDNSGSDAEKTIVGLATLASPTFTGTVTIPTPTAGDNTTKAASTAFVVDGFLPKASPAFTGTGTGVNLTLSGNLTVNGTTTTVATTNTTITDNLLELNSGASSNANDAGILIERGSTGDNAIIAWDESADRFTLGTTTSTNTATGNISVSTGTLAANIVGNVTGNASGTAATVTGAAQTAITSVGTLTGLTVNGGLSLTGNNYDAAWVKSADTFRLQDNTILAFGASDDIKIYHDGSNSYIHHGGAGTLNTRIAKDDGVYNILGNGNTDIAKFVDNAQVELYHNGVKKLETTTNGVTVAGLLTDTLGKVRAIPSNAQGGAYTAVATDAGKAIYISTGGVTINNSVFEAGDALTIINNSGSDQTITQGSGVTLYQCTDGTTGNRTLGARGMVTIWFHSASTAYISGAGLS